MRTPRVTLVPAEESTTFLLGLRCVVWLVLAFTGPLFVQTTRAQAVSDEYRLKAAFLYRFPQFVEWPPESMEGRASLDLCVTDPNPFGTVLHDLVEGEQIDGRPLAVRRVAIDDVEHCDLLYVPAAAPERAALLRRVASLPVLTVSDAAPFLDEGGIVQLRLVASRIRFEINMTAAEQAGLRISPQLLRLAVRVRGGR